VIAIRALIESDEGLAFLHRDLLSLLTIEIEAGCVPAIASGVGEISTAVVGGREATESTEGAVLHAASFLLAAMLKIKVMVCFNMQKSPRVRWDFSARDCPFRRNPVTKSCIF
jgi:hypothetical protein